MIFSEELHGCDIDMVGNEISNWAEFYMKQDFESDFYRYDGIDKPEGRQLQ